MTEPTLTIEPQSHRTTFTAMHTGSLGPEQISVELGYQNTTELYLAADPPRPEELSAALSVLELHLDDVVRIWAAEPSPDDGRTVLDMTVRDGTVRGAGPVFETLAAVEIGLDPYDRDAVDGFELSREAVEDVFRTLATEALGDRLYNPGLSPEWGELILGGACVVVEIYRHWDLRSITVLDPAPGS